MVLLLLLLVSASMADNLSCSAHFPIRESVEILKKLVAKYATPVTRTDSNGAEWINNLIVKNNGLEIEGIRYYLNDNRLPPESTFYFTDSLLLDSVPIFVVEEKSVENWRPDFPDRTQALTKISHRCDIGQRACGLKCCFEETDIVQMGFLELANAGNISEASTYTFNDVTYSVQLVDNSSMTTKCTYYLSYYDRLFRKGMIGGKQVSTIYFSCPRSFSCCGLRCVPPPAAALLRKTRETNLLSFRFDRKCLNALMTAGAIISLFAFIGITCINRRSAAALVARSKMDSRRRRREMIDIQTSTFSLNNDVDYLLDAAHSV